MNTEAHAACKELLQGCDLIIVGASGGIGQYLVENYKNTNRIFGTYCHSISPELIQGPQYFHVDLTDTASIGRFVDGISDQIERPVLVYASGISPNNPVHKINDDDLNQTLAVNLTGAIFVTRGILPVMRKLKFGRLIYFSSVLSRMAVHGTSVYSVTKAGLNAFSKIVAVENAKFGITANSIALGYFDVGIISAVPPDYLNNNVIPRIPQGKLGNPADIANTIEYIARTSYLTGSVIDINGGITAL